MNGSAASASGGSNGTSDGSGGVDVGGVQKTTSTATGDSCTWYARGSCYNPRSCFDCLNVLLPGDSVSYYRGSRGTNELLVLTVLSVDLIGISAALTRPRARA